MKTVLEEYENGILVYIVGWEGLKVWKWIEHRIKDDKIEKYGAYIVFISK